MRMKDDVFYDEMRKTFLEETKSDLYDAITHLEMLQTSFQEQALTEVYRICYVLKGASSVYSVPFLSIAANDIEHLLDTYQQEDTKSPVILEKVLTLVRFLNETVDKILLDTITPEEALVALEHARFAEQSETSQRALVAGADRIYTSIIRHVMEARNIPVDFVKNEVDAFAMLTQQKYTFLLVPYYMTNITGVQMVNIAKTIQEEIQGILITSKERVEDVDCFAIIIQKGSSLREELDAWLERH